jgi:hypothetical protein
MGEEVKDIEAVVLIAAVLLFALLACGAVSLIVLYLLPAPEQAQPEPGPIGNVTGPNITPVAPNTTEVDLVIWSKINKKNVETICLQKAKEEAQSNADLVYSCDCGGIEKTNLKTYRCDIESADPFTNYFANIDCYLDRKECDIETNYGFQKLNFTQLEDFE